MIKGFVMAIRIISATQFLVKQSPPQDQLLIYFFFARLFFRLFDGPRSLPV